MDFDVTVDEAPNGQPLITLVIWGTGFHVTCVLALTEAALLSRRLTEAVASPAAAAGTPEPSTLMQQLRDSLALENSKSIAPK